MGTQIKENKKNNSIIIKVLVVIVLLSFVFFILSLSLSQWMQILLFILLVFATVVTAIFFWKIFLWLIAAGTVIVLIFCGIALLGYIGSLL
ncbi:hypothetical protein GJU40_02985 [Bacillus lacus]|uniref:Uncharacterized protein n=1 Tax=Metabacillus lacus TaxID=1983721 RepID=A0A7X2LW62_9BACI|nr:hypothetical protein [Metabacillus lacus]MRX71135.1 hypothetical protein [Metabacillus lacus]